MTKISMEQLVNESIVEALTRKITDNVLREIRRQMAPYLTELADSRESMGLLCRRITELKETVEDHTGDLTEKLDSIEPVLKDFREHNRKAAEILEKAEV